MKKIGTGHKIYHISDSVNIWPLSVTLTLEVVLQVLYLAYCLIIVTIYAKLFQNPLTYEKVLNRTQNIPFNMLTMLIIYP
jgi:hypothetical protein